MKQPPNRNEKDHGNKDQTDKSYRTDMEFGSAESSLDAEKHTGDDKPDAGKGAPRHPAR